MAGIIRAVQGKGWCDLISCEEGGVLGDTVNLKTEENVEFAICDPCLIRLSSATDPGEVEKMEERIKDQKTRIDELEAQVERVMVAAEQREEKS